MKVSLVRRGGWGAGINPRLPAAVVDSATLAQAAADELARLVAAAKAAPPQEGNPESARDAMTYVITIEDGGATSVLTQSDTTMSSAFVALRDWLRNHAGTR
jgi:hypothetical protein